MDQLTDSKKLKAFEALSGGGMMGQLVRSHDWSRTDVGPIETWPQSLLTSISICLTSRFPMVVWWGPKLTVFYNDGYVPSLGAKHPQALGRHGEDIWPEIWPVIGPMLENVFRTGEATWSEDQFLLMDRNGFPEETFWTFSYSPIRGESGKVEGLFTAVSETTKRVLGERRLRTLRELGNKTTNTRSVEEAAQLTANVLSANASEIPFALIYPMDGQDQSVLKLKGMTGTALEKDGVPDEILLNNDQAGFSKYLIQALKEGKPVIVEKPLEKLGKIAQSPLPEQLRYSMVLPIASSEQDKPAGVLVVGISPRLSFDEDYQGYLGLVSGQLATALSTARAYEEEKKRAEALAEIDRAKTAFFSNVSHEFRTPLTLMLGPLGDNLADEASMSPVLRERNQLAHRNALRLLKLVNSLLDFSRIEAGRSKATFRPTDLSELTTDLASVFRSIIEKAGLKLITTVPSLGEQVYVDREMWEKIVLNLLSNAFKFTYDGEIEVKLVKDGRMARLSVRDSGTGIPESELPHLFERFHRVEGARGRSYEGSGIGLALIQELVKLHGGEIHVESKPDQGTTFTVSVPLGKAHLPENQVEDSQPGSSKTGTLGAAFGEEALRWLPDETNTSEQNLRAETSSIGDKVTNTTGARILLADDNSDMRSYIRRLLEQSGWMVETASDGLIAFNKALINPPDLILTDVMMPGLDGFGLLKKLRENKVTQTTPVIMLSARAGEESRVEGMEAGADDYLVKPFSARELMARVGAHLEKARSRKGADNFEDRIRLEERQVIERDKLFKAVLDYSKDFIGMADANGKPIYVNPAGRKAVGLDSIEDVLKSDIIDYFPEEEKERVLKELMPTILRDGFWDGRVLFQNFKTGEKIPFSWNMVTIPDEINSGIRAIACVSKNLTEQEERERALKEAVRARDEFLSIASHELKTPVTSLKMQLEMTNRNVKPQENLAPSPDKLQRSLEISIRQVHKLTALIDDLLDVSRIESGKLTLNPKETNFSELVKEVIDRFADQFKAASMPLNLNISPSVLLVCDPFRIEQIVTNLFTNAIKYGPGKEVEIKVNLSPAGKALFSVKDHGMGIPDEKKDKVFERFERAITNTNVSGLGLGLYISKQIAEAHGGQITLNSKLGEGSTFILELPLSMKKSIGN